ncbi:MAG: flippase-like domain-containing protein [Acidobacteria bacterium]|nr:flippase-like domain-containing protein [Acidobacteriota bacterium]
MRRSVPQLVSVAAVVLGITLFIVTLFYIDLEETFASANRLGLALPVILLPGTAWHLLRTWGWAISFPDQTRPPFTRLFRVRLAADAVGFFTVRGVANEPLKVLLLYDRVKPEVTTAAVALERLAFAVIGTVIAALISFFAVTRLSMPGAWDTVFTLLIVGAVMVLGVFGVMARRRSGDYLGRLVLLIDRVTGRHLEASRAVRFVLEVEDVLLALLRGDRRRLVTLTALASICYLLMALEIWLVFWAIGEPIGAMQGLAVETFARLASVASAAIPGNIGALEASNAAVVAALGLGGGGSLALTRRIRALLWAAAGLALYPRVQERRQ